MTTPENTPKKKRDRFTLIFCLICLLILSIALLYWWKVWKYEEYTNDAYVEGNKVYITPLVAGFVTAIRTDDTFLVKEGELLIQLDETDAIIALEKAKNDLGKTVRDICQSFHDVSIYFADVAIIKAELIKALQDYQHRAEAIKIEGVSLEDLEHATAALRSRYHALKNREALYKKALAFVEGTSIKNHPSVQAMVHHVREKWVQHYRCKIYSPVTGLAAQRTVQVGMHVHPGESLMCVIPLNQIWVNANFKETQLKDVKIGQKAKITSDLYGSDVVFHGEVIGLPGGAGNAFSLLPPQNLSGNWIKIVQRLPVRVALHPGELEKFPLRVGLSMEVVVDLHDQTGLLVPTSSTKAPSYETPIFLQEEMGAKEAAEQVIAANMDMSLEQYMTHPFSGETLDTSFSVADFDLVDVWK